MLDNIVNKNLFDFSNTIAINLFKNYIYPWEILPEIGNFISYIGKHLSTEEYFHPENDIWIAKNATIFSSAYISGPCIIGFNTEIRHCAFIRGNAIIGNNCVVGNSTELKNVILFNNVQVPHYNYVGDSILGYSSHMGAGAITSNIKCDKKPITIKDQNGNLCFNTKMKKFGAIIGDYVEIGCNSVLNPGTIIGKNSNIYPLSCIRGIIPANSIYKTCNNIVLKSK